ASPCVFAGAVHDPVGRDDGGLSDQHPADAGSVHLRPAIHHPGRSRLGAQVARGTHPETQKENIMRKSALAGAGIAAVVGLTLSACSSTPQESPSSTPGEQP